MKDSIRRSLRKRLLSLMREISQDHFLAGWMMGLEYDLWRAVLQYPKPYESSFIPIEEEDVAELKDLAEELQEWGIREGGDARERLIPLAEWKQMFATHEAANGK